MIIQAYLVDWVAPTRGFSRGTVGAPKAHPTTHVRVRSTRDHCNRGWPRPEGRGREATRSTARIIRIISNTRSRFASVLKRGRRWPIGRFGRRLLVLTHTALRDRATLRMPAISSKVHTNMRSCMRLRRPDALRLKPKASGPPSVGSFLSLTVNP